MENMKNPENTKITWGTVEQELPNVETVSGGYSDAKRGILTMPEGKRLFVKIGMSEATKGWAQKETRVYDFLSQAGFKHIPELVSRNEDCSSFALEALEAKDGWDWSETWNEERLTATLRALDELAETKPPTDSPDVITPILSTAKNGWIELAESEELAATFLQKLAQKEQEMLAEQVSAFAQSTAEFIFRKDALVHNDVRADNCAWNPDTGEVRLVDWNWLELGDRRTDLTATLVHIHQSGHDVLEKHAERLDSEALHWIAGYWLAAASKPIWPGGPESLRDFQLDSGMTALKLAEHIRK